MLLNITGSKATGTGVAGSHQITMAMNAKTFHTLSSALYKDKYGAIIREICSNAYDAHTAAGISERPFVLTFPDRIDSELVIRDFGSGISPQDMFEIFCVMFESTKDDSNDAIGAYGLGSKTPWSYTDTFTVTSIYKGMKRIYTAFKDAGMPNIKLMAEIETDEESGLAVSIPVQAKDISSFEQAVLRELRFFSVKPESNVEWNWAEKETTMDLESVQFYNTTAKVLGGFFVQIGVVGYRIDKEMIEEYASKKNIKLSTLAKHLINMQSSYNRYSGSPREGAMLDMPIGTVEVQPSREGLHYTEETCQNIIDSISAAERKIATEMVKRLDTAYAISARNFFEEVNSLPSFLRAPLSNIPNFETKYAPFIINADNGSLEVSWDTSIVGDGNSEVTTAIIGKIAPTSGRGYGLVGMSEKVTDERLVRIDEDYRGVKTTRHVGVELFRVPRVYIKDEAFAYKSRIRAHDDNTVSMFIMPVGRQNVDDLVAYFEQYLEVVRVSELDKNVTRSSTSTTGGRSRSWFELGEWLSNRSIHKVATPIYQTLYSMRVKSVFDEVLNDIDVPTVVVRTNNNKLAYDDDTVNEKLSLAAMLHEAGYKVIAIPKNTTYKNDNLCDLDKLTDDHLKALRDLIERVSVTYALNSAVDFANKFNASVDAMKDKGWIKDNGFKFDFETLKKAFHNAPTLSSSRTNADIEVAKMVSGAENVKTTYADMDELFILVNKTAGTKEVPSELLSRVKEELLLKKVLLDFLNNGQHSATRYTEVDFSSSIVDSPFLFDPKLWLIDKVV